MVQRIIAGLMLVFILAACGGPETTTTTTVPTETPASAATTPMTAATSAPTNSTMAEPTAATEPTTAAPSGATGSLQRYVIVPAESQVQYEVDETFFREGNVLATAIGTTQEIQGEILIDTTAPQNSSVGVITIDISAFTSDEERRDQRIREEWLESATFPLATFTPTSITGLPETYTEGEPLTFQVTGDMTVRETTKPVTFDVTAQLVNDTVTGTATSNIQMTDFGFDPPDIANILRAENDVKLTFDFVARPEA